ncbi:sigma-70 family RNA polymerase sigma factor [Corallococcus sp. BB11-1]|uniref:sigma-70 family RNA polymerase sigma factor n=1 Tax=Corallococcus sp. BB11-1 TaxID=2996783 RepID=UPI00226FDFCF|nr:sigma-70 family RNA polymerase sigma factor [Corallococcus sp. BB11-1]MCY1033237.1 sigma-70 family RNA polymerase sigma factor [Corallococcus sp. BB11-1]
MAIRTAEARRAYRLVRRNWEALSDFEEPEALVSFLTAREGDSHVKDGLLAGLVTLVQMGASARFFVALLWLGLWPGLDGVYRRCLRRTGHPPAEVVSSIAASFMSLVARVSLAGVQRVAGTLVRGTERDVLKAWHKELVEQRHRARLQLLADVGGGALLVPWLTPSASRTRSFNAEVEELRAWLLPLTGEDTDLVVSVLLREEDYVEVAASRGLSPETARKRVQRALGRLRKMKKKCPEKIPCPKSAGGGAF